MTDFIGYTDNSRLSVKEFAVLLNRPRTWVTNRLAKPEQYVIKLPRPDSETYHSHKFGRTKVFLWKFSNIKQFIIDNRL